MNILINMHEYVERNGCHNCLYCIEHYKFIKRLLLDNKIYICNLDDKKINPWGCCKKWENKNENDK